VDLDLKGRKERQADLDQQEHKVQLDLQADLDQQEHKERLDLQADLDQQEHKERLDLQVDLDQQERKAQLEHKEQDLLQFHQTRLITYYSRMVQVIQQLLTLT
jgi:hypothetical protein